MSPIKKKAEPKKSTPVKKTEASNSKTKAVTSKQSLKKKLNEFGDEDAL
jgi:hypothetical protein